MATKGACSWQLLNDKQLVGICVMHLINFFSRKIQIPHGWANDETRTKTRHSLKMWANAPAWGKGKLR